MIARLAPASRGSLPLLTAALAALFAAAFVVNYFLLPDNQVVSSLYAIPVLVAAHCSSIRGIAATGATAVSVYLVNAFIEGRPLVVWPFGVAALAAVTYLAVLFAIERRRAADRAAETARAHRRLEEFLGLVGHDLAGALTGLVGYADLLVDGDGPINREQAQAAIDGASRRMGRLIDDLRDATSIGTGHFEIRRAPMDLAKLIDRLVAEHQATAGGHEFVIEESDVIKGSWDEERLGQLFSNLLSNAVNYSPPDGRIRVRVARHGDEAVVDISDEGRGIPLEQQKFLFHRFFRADAAKGIKGMGLGLCIAKAIADAHGSRIRVHSTPATGTTFSVSLPIDDD